MALQKSIILLTSLLAIINGSNANTYYSCYYDRSPKFHNYCDIALTKLVARMTGADNWAWVPGARQYETWGTCTASIKSNGGQRVWAVALLESFDQLASRCQYGVWNWDGGFVEAGLVGKAGLGKRDLDYIATINNDTRHANDDDILSHGFAGLTPIATWTFDEPYLEPQSAIEKRSLPRRPAGVETAASEVAGEKSLSPSNRLQQRAQPRGRMIARQTINGVAYVLYRATQAALNGIYPSEDPLRTKMYFTVGDMVQGLRNRQDGKTISGNEATLADRSFVVAFALQLNGWVKTWAELSGIMSDKSFSGLKDLCNDALNDFFDNHLTTGVYHLWHADKEEWITMIINGVGGSTTPLPSS